MSITTTPTGSASLAKLASAQLKITLRNGTVHVFNVNSGANHVLVTGLVDVNAAAVVNDLSHAAFNSSCSISI